MFHSIKFISKHTGPIPFQIFKKNLSKGKVGIIMERFGLDGTLKPLLFQALP